MSERDILQEAAERIREARHSFAIAYELPANHPAMFAFDRAIEAVLRVAPDAVEKEQVEA